MSFLPGEIKDIDIDVCNQGPVEQTEPGSASHLVIIKGIHQKTSAYSLSPPAQAKGHLV